MLVLEAAQVRPRPWNSKYEFSYRSFLPRFIAPMSPVLLQRAITDVVTASEATGIGHVIANKGAVAISFKVGGSHWDPLTCLKSRDASMSGP